MNVTLLDNLPALEALAPAWHALAGDLPLLGPDWHRGWIRHYLDSDHGDSQPFVLAVYEEAANEAEGPATSLKGLALWSLERSRRRGNVIRWLGSGEVCTDHLTLLCQKEAEEPVTTAIAEFLTQEFTDWDLLSLDDIDANDTSIERLNDALTQRGTTLQSHEAGNTWAIDLPNTWEAFLQMQSKSHRKQLRRAERKLQDPELCCWHPVKTPEQLNEAWPILVDLHQRRRISLGEPGCFASPQFEAFHRELAEQLLEKNQLRISWLAMNGRPAAAEYHFASETTLFAYQGGVEPELIDDEPGRLSLIATIQEAIAEGKTTFDLMRGDEHYKAHWRAEPHPTRHYRLVPDRRAAQLRSQVTQAAGSLKSIVKSGLSNFQKPQGV